MQILLHLKVDVSESLEAVAANQGSGATPNTAAELWHLLKFRQCGEKHTSPGLMAASHTERPTVSQRTPGGFGKQTELTESMAAIKNRKKLTL